MRQPDLIIKGTFAIAQRGRSSKVNWVVLCTWLSLDVLVMLAQSSRFSIAFVVTEVAGNEIGFGLDDWLLGFSFDTGLAN